MRQVLDIFELLTAQQNQGVEWKLINATTNSPFLLEGEAISYEPSVDVSVIARAQKITVGSGLRSLSNGRPPRDWDDKRLNIAKRLFRRNLNGVGSTTIEFDTGEPVLITPRRAQDAMLVLEARAPDTFYELPTIKEEIGSIEGKFFELGTHWNHPAVRIIEQLTGQEVWCRLNAELMPTFSNKATFADIWEHKRVIVRGLIHYNADGAIGYVLANDIQKIEARDVSTNEIRDKEFTGSLSTVEYLDKFRDGSLG